MAAFLQRSPGVLTGGVLFGAFAAAAIAPQTRLFSGGAFAGKFGEPLSFVLAGGAAGLAAALLLQTGKGRRFPLSWLAAAVFPAVTGGWFLGGLAGWSLVFWNPGLLSFDYRSSEAVYAGWVAGSLAGQLCGWAFAVFGTLLSPEPEPEQFSAPRTAEPPRTGMPEPFPKPFRIDLPKRELPGREKSGK